MLTQVNCSSVYVSYWTLHLNIYSDPIVPHPRYKVHPSLREACFARVSSYVFQSPAKQLQLLKPSIKTSLSIHFDSLLKHHSRFNWGFSLRPEGQRASAFCLYLLLLVPVSCLFAKCDRHSPWINCHKRVTIDFQSYLTLYMGKLC